MDIGVIFPQTEIAGDRGAARTFGEAASELGFTHLAAYDHVLGGDTAVHGDLGGPYTIDNTFREPLVMFAYLAGITDLGFATSILIGPQRQTALLAKQAAELDILCGGRFRLGLGIGWNRVEYDALGDDVRTTAATGWRSRSTSYANCGPKRASRSTDGSTTSPRQAWPRRHCSVPSPSGSVPMHPPRCDESVASPTAGSPRSAPEAG